MKWFLDRWNWFWFDSRSNDHLENLGVFRVVFGATMFFFFSSRHLDVSFFYGESGVMPSAYLSQIELMKYHYSIFTWLTSDRALLIGHWLLLILTAMFTLGVFYRPVAILVWLLNMMFLNRNPSAMFGVDMISSYYFLYMAFADGAARWSVGSRVFKPKTEHGWVSHIFLRLMQVQLCVIYAYAGLEKLKGVRWWDGSAIWDVMSMGNMQRWDFSVVAHVPFLLALMTYTVLFWEIYFWVLVWNPRLRPWVLGYGVAMHIGIGLFMNLPAFAAMMMAFYLLFLDREELNRVLRPVLGVAARLGLTPTRS